MAITAISSIEHAYNAAPITVAAAAGADAARAQSDRAGAQNWIVRGLSISPSYAATNEAIDMVEISDHNYFGPAWDIEFSGSDVFSVDDASSWGADEWVNLASSGIYVGAARISVHDNTLRNVRFGIGVDGADASIRRNVIDGFSADGLRGLGDDDVFEYNTRHEQQDRRSRRRATTTTVSRAGRSARTARSARARSPALCCAAISSSMRPIRTIRSGARCRASAASTASSTSWIVENNVVITDHWHGISFYGMRDSRIVNNSVIDLADGQPGPPWIMVTDHKNGTPSDERHRAQQSRDRLRALAATTSPTITTSHDRRRRRAVRRAAVRSASAARARQRSMRAARDLAPNVDIEGTAAAARRRLRLRRVRAGRSMRFSQRFREPLTRTRMMRRMRSTLFERGEMDVAQIVFVQAADSASPRCARAARAGRAAPAAADRIAQLVEPAKPAARHDRYRRFGQHRIVGRRPVDDADGAHAPRPFLDAPLRGRQRIEQLELARRNRPVPPGQRDTD